MVQKLLSYLFLSYVGLRDSEFISRARINAFRTRGASIGLKSTFQTGVRLYNSKCITIGNNTFLGRDVKVYAYGSHVTIGENTLIASDVKIITRNHKFDSLEVNINEQGYSSSPIIIGSNVWIGFNVVVLEGVRIGDGCVIGANSLVTKDIPSNTIAVGSPCRVIGER
jgi:acetyltransferase-like isoleucine patch superfamily enzyme